MTTTILNGDCRAWLKKLPDRSVHCIVTSPPYHGLRDYGVKNQIGIEPTLTAYVEQLVEVFREARRVLRDDGTLWLNLGDAFANKKSPAENLKPKDLTGLPWRVAFALQEDGWWLRSDIVWAKKAPLPESVRDRPTRSHEFVFLLTKSRDYFYDIDAVREPFAPATIKRISQAGFDQQKGGPKDGINPNRSPRRALVNLKKRALPPQLEDRPHTAPGRNMRSVWTIGYEPFRGGHFACFPQKLVEPCIKAGTSEKGCCPRCGAPWQRIVCSKSFVQHDKSSGRKKFRAANGKSLRGSMYQVSEILGWEPSCSCPKADPIPCTVLDPFGGAGTTALVAEKLNRQAVLIELNSEYAHMAAARIAKAGFKKPKIRKAHVR
ncbi:MAG: site-specific DNA-methyltransferase [Alphaproteobacteria bacterium]|nr:site-specific DNA-methyltransferase [Alphaproteobacteria bacterium]